MRGAVCIVPNPTTGPRANSESPGRKVVMLMAQQLKLALPVPEGYEIRFVASITLRNGKKLFAKQFGKKAFPIVVKTKH